MASFIWPPQPSGGGGGSGTVTSVDVSGGTTGLTTSGGPVTSSGTIVLSGTLDVANGGTGDTSLTLDGILYGNGTSPVGVTAAGSTGQVLTATTGSAPTWQTPAGSGGTVTSVSVTSANGVSGTVATATTTPAITLALGAITPTSVAATGNVTGANLSNTNSGDVTLTAVGAAPSANAASLSGQALTLQPFDGTHPGVVVASGGGTANFLRADGSWAAPAGTGVSSFTGDSTVINNSASTGAVTATLASAAPYTALGNFTGSSAAPTYSFIQVGFLSTATAVTLTSNSPGYIYSTAAGANITLPSASTCIGKTFHIFMGTVSAGSTIIAPAGDTLTIRTTNVSPYNMTGGQGTIVLATASVNWALISPAAVFTVSGIEPGVGSIPYFNTTNIASVANTAVGTSNQLLQAGVAAAPTWTSTPGSATALTSITNIKNISAGTASTISGNATLGSGGTVAFVGTGHDESGQFTVTAGTGATAAVVTVTFGGAAYAVAPNVNFSPASLTAAGIASTCFISSQSTTAWALTFGALTGALTYTFNYIVKQ